MLGPRLVVAGTHSGVGKTTIASGLMAAFAHRGLRVAPAKVGPDFIDPGYHSLATGRPGRNLDAWMCGPDAIAPLAGRAAQDADLLVVEGVMSKGRLEVGLVKGTDYELMVSNQNSARMPRFECEHRAHGTLPRQLRPCSFMAPITLMGTRMLGAAVGLLADRAFGEPPNAVHPVAAFGRAEILG